MGPVLDFNHYTVAWIAPLQIEASAAIRMLDKIHEGNFRSDPGDDYQYIGGEINGHNVVVATLPPGTQYGGASAAALAAQVRKCFQRLWFGLLVGIAAGLPDLSRDPPLDIRLGDVLISGPDSDNAGVVQYDFGKQRPGSFENRSQQALTASIVRATFGRIRSLAEVQGNVFLKHMKRIEDVRDEDGKALFEYPGQDMDHLYETGDKKDTLVQRDRRADESRTRVWYGNIGSGNTLMKSCRERDQLRDEYKIIGLEMEAAGTMNTIPVGNIRGVCDYADVHKPLDWRGYAAAVAAAYAREVLYTINPPEEQREQRKRLDTIPFPRNQNMVPRDDIMKKLDKLLDTNNGSHRAAIWGLGGSGKTQIALEYTYRRKDKLSCPAFWVHASSEARFTDDYNKIAKKAGLPSELKGVDMLQAVHDWLDNQVDWFLVLDNADDIQIFLDNNEQTQSRGLLRYIPQTPAGSILWTSRDGGIVRSLVGKDDGVMVGAMSLEESVKLLRGLQIEPKSTTASIDEENLLGRDVLGGLPLAITQAQAFMEINGVSVSEYLRLFVGSESELLDNEFSDTYRLGVPNSVMRTWRISMTQIAKESPCAERILKTIAFFDNQGIPFELIREAAVSESNQSLGNLSEISVLQATGRLVQYSFLQRQQKISEEDLPTYEQHRLPQLAMRNTIDPSEAPVFSKRAQKIMQKLFPYVEVETWSLCKRYLPHALKIVTSRDGDSSDEWFPEILLRIGVYYFQQGLYQRAERFHLLAFQLRMTYLGEGDMETLRAMHGLALTHFEQGYYDKAESAQLQILKLSKILLGEKQPDTIMAMSSLALTWYIKGQYDKSELLQAQVLELSKAVLGEKHPDTVKAMNNLASTWNAQGYFNKTEPLRAQGLKLRKAVLGDKHPDTLMGMNNLASTWYSQGYYDKAEPLQAQVVELRKAVLGNKHPDTIMAMSNLASTWYRQGQYDKAEPLQAQAVELRKAVLGEKHSDTIRAIHNLAWIWRAQGYNSKAEKLFYETLELWTVTLGESHPRTRKAVESIAEMYEITGREQEAVALRMKWLSLKAIVEK